MKSNFKIYLLVIIILFFNIACDQITKEIARQKLKGQGTIKVIGDFFVLQYTENNGAFLGLGSNIDEPYKGILLILLPCCFVLITMVYLYCYRDKLSRYHVFAFLLILSGGIGNLIDRIFNNGYVSDFIIFGIAGLRTGILNIADIFITVGAIIIGIVEIVIYKNKKKVKNPIVN